MTETHSEAEIPVAKDDEVVALGHYYAEYLHLDASPQMKHFEDSIEELLTRLDEYHGLLDMVRSDTSLCLQKNIPLIEAKNAEMEKMFERIDKLEAFVGVVRRSMSDMEDKVDEAEAQLGSFSSIRKVFGSIPLPPFLSSKKTSPGKNVPSYTGPAIYRTKDYIGSPSSVKQTNSVSETPRPDSTDSTTLNNIPTSHTGSDVAVTDIIQATRVSEAASDVNNSPQNPEPSAAEPLSQSDSGFQSPAHLDADNDVKCKEPKVSS